MTAHVVPPPERPLTALELCERASLPPEAKAAAREGMNYRQFVEELLARRKFVVAVDAAACALPQRRAIWWGCLCLQHAMGDALQPAERAAAKAVVEWVMRPCELTRVAARPFAEAGGPQCAATALALATFQTTLPDASPASNQFGPAPYAAAKAVARAVKILSIRGDMAEMPKKLRNYAELGLSLMKGSGS